MINENQIIKMKWSSSNKKKYVDKGYEFTKMGDSFNLNIKDLSRGSKLYIECICDYCNQKKQVQYQLYMRNHNNEKWGEYICQSCYYKHIADYSLVNRQKDIYSRVKSICDRFDYDLITQIKDIKTVDSKIKYVCKKHGEQSRRAHLFMYGEHICPECNRGNKKLSPDDVFNRIKLCGGLLLNKDEYHDATTKNLKIICRKCQDVFITSYNSYIHTRNGDGQCCNNCSKTMSYGEIKIANYLDDNNITYIYQHSFSDCKDKNVLPFDFYIPSQKKAIEYDGIQHFTPVSFGGDVDALDNLEYVKMHDNIKTKYCHDKNIILLRIPYYEYDNIYNILDNELNKSHEDIV